MTNLGSISACFYSEAVHHVEVTCGIYKEHSLLKNKLQFYAWPIMHNIL